MSFHILRTKLACHRLISLPVTHARIRKRIFAPDPGAPLGFDVASQNAAYLAEYFAANDVRCAVVGVPKTIDDDFRGGDVETCFGFDTCSKHFAQTIKIGLSKNVPTSTGP